MKYLCTVAPAIGRGGMQLSADKNGLNPLRLNPIDGSQLPERARVISGTIAKSLGLTDDEGTPKQGIFNISVSVTGNHDEYGTQYGYTVLPLEALAVEGSTVAGMLLLGALGGAPTVQPITQSAPVDNETEKVPADVMGEAVTKTKV